MIGWIVFGLYLLGYVACWRTVTWWFACEGGDEVVDGGFGVIFGVFCGSLVTGVWPLILAGIITQRIYTSRGDTIQSLIVPRAQKRRVALDARERRIAELEREVGIR